MLTTATFFNSLSGGYNSDDQFLNTVEAASTLGSWSQVAGKDMPEKKSHLCSVMAEKVKHLHVFSYHDFAS